MGSPLKGVKTLRHYGVRRICQAGNLDGLKYPLFSNSLRGCRTGGRVVEGTGLENRHTGEPGIESSNLSLSVFTSSRYLIGPASLRCGGRVCAGATSLKLNAFW